MQLTIKISVLASLVYFGNCPSWADSATKEDLLLIQKSTLGGDVKLTIAPEKCKIEISRPAFVILADSQHMDTVTIYSPQHKLFCKESPSKLVGLGGGNDGGSDPRTYFAKIANITACTVAGVKARQITAFPNARIEKDTYIGTLSSVQEPHKKSEFYTITRADYFASATTDVPQKILNLLRQVSRTPNIGGLPLGLVLHKSNGRTVTVFETESVTHLHVDPREFNCPPNYKEVKTEIECVFGSDKVTQLEDMFKDMQVGEDFGTPKTNTKPKPPESRPHAR